MQEHAAAIKAYHAPQRALVKLGDVKSRVREGLQELPVRGKKQSAFTLIVQPAVNRFKTLLRLQYSLEGRVVISWCTRRERADLPTALRSLR